jgi:hypothetical protein
MRHPDNRAQVPALAAALLLAAALFSFLWMPEALYRGGIMKRINGMEKNMDKIKGDTRTAALYLVLSDEADWLEKRAANGTGDGDILMNINNLARRAGIKLSVENASEDKDPPAGFEAGLQSLVLTGNYAGLRRFVYGLENLEVLTVIRKARIERTGKTPGNVKAWIDLVYYKKNQVRAGIK